MYKKFYRDVEDVMVMTNHYHDNGEPYEMETAGSSLTLKKFGVQHYASMLGAKNPIPPSELNFISKLKRSITSRGLLEAIPALYHDVDKILFNEINPDIPAGKTFHNCFSVDIKQAYWQSALNIGYLSDQLYKDGMKVNKIVRLASLGSFAKVRNIYRFDGEKCLTPLVIDPEHPEVFYNCAYMTYLAMKECMEALGDDFLLYWTDGIYMKSEASTKVCLDILYKHGYEGKVEPIIKVVRSPRAFTTHEKNPEGLRTKTYFTNTLR